MPAMDAEALKQKTRRTREQEYRSFLALYRGENDVVLNPPLPPAGTNFNNVPENVDLADRVEALYREVYASPYLRHFNLPELRATFKNLEALLVATPGVDVGLGDLGRKRRELRFLHRFAQIVKWKDYERSPPDQKALSSGRKRIAEMCLPLEDLLLDQLEDEHLLRKLHNSDLAALPELIKQLGRFGEVFQTVKPDLPYERNRTPENSVMRLVLDDLAECCYRVYEACSYEVVRMLLKSCWLHGYAGIRKGELEALINAALERKQTDYLARTAPREDDALAPEMVWMPVRSL